VGAVSGLVGDGLRSEARPHAAPERHAADSLAVKDVIVGGPQGRSVLDRYLVLAVAELRVIVLDPQALRVHRPNELDDEVVTLVESGDRVAEAVVHRC